IARCKNFERQKGAGKKRSSDRRSSLLQKGNRTMYLKKNEGAPPLRNAPSKTLLIRANTSVDHSFEQVKAAWPSWAVPQREFERRGKFIVWPRAGAHRDAACERQDRARDRDDLIKSLQRHEELKPAIEAFTLLWEQQDRGVMFDAWATISKEEFLKRIGATPQKNPNPNSAVDSQKP